LFHRSIDDIENAIEEANEHTENMRQIQEALATPIGASADFDEVLLIFPFPLWCQLTSGARSSYVIQNSHSTEM
jgi:hypothetical protein